MTNHDFYTLWGAALESADRDTYIAEWGTSAVFDPDPDADGPDFNAVADTLGGIWDAAHMGVADIRKAVGMTQAQFAERLCVSRRTVEGWEARGCPSYIRLMLCELSGLLKR